MVVEPTAKTDHEVRATLSAMHRSMLAAVEGLTPAELAGAAAFLRALIRSVEEHDEDEADQPA